MFSTVAAVKAADLTLIFVADYGLLNSYESVIN
jgi:hypothetical protein